MNDATGLNRCCTQLLERASGVQLRAGDPLHYQQKSNGRLSIRPRLFIQRRDYHSMPSL